MQASAPTDSGTWSHWHIHGEPIRLGISSCLLGEEVRYDGGHARDRFAADVLSEWMEFVSVCPEVEMGMDIPRPTIRLADEGDGVQLIAPSTGEDFTEQMQTYSARRVSELQELDLDGYILKRRSPSCGMERIKIYRKGAALSTNNPGLFAAELMQRWPSLPIEEEGRLNDPGLRVNFIERVFCRNRWRVLAKRGLTRRLLVDFHTAHKLLIRAHNEAAYQKLGQLVGSAGSMDDEQLYAAYEAEFQRALSFKASRKLHVNVLMHAMGYLKDKLGQVEKKEILSSIEDFRLGLLPLIVPLTLLNYNIKLYEIEYLMGQLYFAPHPKELMLRNHA